MIFQSKRKNCSNKKAFTLVEALAALALLAVIAPVLGKVWVSCTKTSGELARRITANNLGKTTLNKYLDGAIDSSERSGDYSPDYPQYSWEIGIDSWPEDSLFQQLSITVSWTSGEHDRNITLSALKAASD